MKINIKFQPKANSQKQTASSHKFRIFFPPFGGIKGGFLLIFFLFFSTTLKAQNQEWQWMHSIGGIGPGPNTSDQDQITNFRVDKWGNSYMSGTFYNSIDIQNINIQAAPLVTNNRNANNGFIAKFDCEGNVEWASKWGSANGGGIWNILPTDKYLYVNGVAATQQNYPCYISDSIISNGQFGFVGRALAKYDLDGNLLSYKIYDKKVTVAYEGLLQEDKDGNLISLGYSDSVYIDGNYIERGYCLFQLDSNGNYLNHVLLSNLSGQNTSFNFLKLDEQDNIYVGGSLDSAMHTFAGVQPDYGVSNTVSFISKFNNNFNIQWFEQNENIGPNIGTTCFNLATDSSFNSYVSFRAYNYKPYINQTYRGTVFQGDTVKNSLNSIYSSLKFVINKYDEDGNLVWMKQVNSFRTDENSKLDLYVSKDTIVAFGLIGAGDFNIDNYNTTLANTSYMMLKLDTNGNKLDIQFYPTVSGTYQVPFGSFLSSSNNFHLVGMHSDYIQFPDSTLYPLKGAGSNQDIFIAKYGTNTCFRCDSVLLAFEVEQSIGYTAQVTANTTQFAESYEWDFGNGQTSTDSFPTLSIVYPDTGTYTVCLTAQNYCDTQTLCQQIHIGCPPPLAQGFTYALGNNSLEIQSMQVQQYDNYTWYFGDGESSTDSLPNHQYNASGTYNVCLAAQNLCGVDSFCQTVNITCPNPIILAAELTQDTFYLAANNINIVNYDSVYWNFGDGQNSTDLFAENNFAQEGIYNVCLSAYNICGDSTYCQELAIIGTGIVNLNNGGSINVYPNPTNGIINIEAKEINTNYQIEIIDISGKRVLKDKLNSTKKQVNIENLSNGLYYLQLSNRKESYSVGVIKR